MLPCEKLEVLSLWLCRYLDITPLGLVVSLGLKASLRGTVCSPIVSIQTDQSEVSPTKRGLVVGYNLIVPSL